MKITKEGMTITVILQVYLIIIACVFYIEMLDQVDTYLLSFPFNFWDALVAVGTVGVVFTTGIFEVIKERDKRRNERSRMVKNIKNEIIINFDQLHYNSLNQRDFRLETRQLDVLLSNPHMINIDAKGIYRPLNMFYLSAKAFNKRIQTTKLDIFEWQRLKVDNIKHMLMILWLCGGIDFENEGEKMIVAINNYIAGDHKYESAAQLALLASGDFLKGEHLLDEKGFDLLKEFGPISYDEMLKKLNDITDNQLSLEKDIIFENYLIVEFVRIFNEKKKKLLDRLEKSLEKLISSDSTIY